MLFNSISTLSLIKNWGETPDKKTFFARCFWVGEANYNTNFINAVFVNKYFGACRLLLKIKVINQMINQKIKNIVLINHLATLKGYRCQNGVFFNKIVCFFGGY